MNMNDASLVNLRNVRVQACGTSDRFDDSACTTQVTIDHADIIPQQSGEGVQWTPRDPLGQRMWYRITLNGAVGGMQSATDVLLDGNRDGTAGGDYVWFFRTDATTCAADRVLVSPATATIEAPTQSATFGANALAANCNALATTTPWSWMSTDIGKAIVAPIEMNGPVAIATPVAETAGTPVRIRAKMPTKTGEAALTIAYPAPRVIAQWPICGAACTNAEIGARFSATIDPATIVTTGPTTAQTVLLYRCRATNQTVVQRAEGLRTSIEALDARARSVRDAAQRVVELLSGVTFPVGQPEPRIDEREMTATTNVAVTAERAAEAVQAAQDQLASLTTLLGTTATQQERDRLALATTQKDAATMNAVSARAAAQSANAPSGTRAPQPN